MSNSKSINPAVAGIVIVVILAVIVAVGYQYLNRPPSDPVADAVAKERARTGVTVAPDGPMRGAAPPKAGATDYARPDAASPGKP